MAQAAIIIQRDELVSLSIRKMKGETVTDFDLYIDIGGHLVLYAPSPYKWSQDELSRLNREGHIELFYQREQALLVEAYAKISEIHSINELLAPKERITSITDVAAEFTRVLYEHPLSQTSLTKGHQIIDSLISCIQENRTCVTALGLLAEHDLYTYYHSGRAAAYAVAIAIQMTLSDRSLLEELALGCLLHDVGKSKVSSEILLKKGPLRPAEWDIIRKHPLFGVELTRDAKLDVIPTEIILHHHERIDGRGYPHGLGRHELLEEVTIASFSDVFDALTTNRPYQETRTKYQALDFIRHNMLEQVNKDAFCALVEILR